MRFHGLPTFFGSRVRLRLVLAVFGLVGPLHLPSALAGQGHIRDLVISAGVAGEAWRGDFAALTVPQVDSTQRAVAWVGEWSAKGIFTVFRREHSSLETTLDAGFRQFATTGFQLRNYAPREHSGVLTTRYDQKIADGASGTAFAEAQARMRWITDRPPMPLYLSPGYETYRVTAGYKRLIRAVGADLRVTGENADYAAPALLPSLDVLDRSSLIVEAGSEYSGFRLFSAYRYHSYPKQGQGLGRVDHALGLGGTYQRTGERLYLEATLDGTRSRSNSHRVQYNAARLRVEVQWGLTEKMEFGVLGTLARKRYLDPGQDALVPGEEADGETSLYAEITRRLGMGVDGAFRLGWQKVETHFTGAYYTRFGGAFFLRARPGG